MDSHEQHTVIIGVHTVYIGNQRHFLQKLT